ncbi:hypothetical protein FPOAC2_08877 [Fusarium poae]|jgi:hypothetical protein|uniref:Uncharacterized protein n=1 Tax=Fusarium poae TaxID=36050 RepID=A0A1B8AN63_FUSPO|nr:hypothetical protein FPOAC1_008939 [Fusarium poae]KAG8669544.1 hypothetical protein FPOAC1_008939 [Fusarium poae]OBS21766.1 hypothetical protein FPOA_08103 [Fusarium poae]
MGSFTSKPQKADHISGKRKRSVDDHPDCPPAKKTRPAHIPDEQHIMSFTQNAALQAECISRYPRVTKTDPKDKTRVVESRCNDPGAGISEQLQKLRADAKLTCNKIHEAIKWFDKNVDVDNEGQFVDADHGFWLEIALSSVKADLFLMANQTKDIIEKNCSNIAELVASGELNRSTVADRISVQRQG